MSINETTTGDKNNRDLEEVSILETGELDDARMILSDRTRLFYSGIIRAGAKIPKNSCTAAEKTKFKQLEDQGMPYDEIDKALGGTPKSNKSKLFPTNVDYFVIRDCDFKNSADAQFIRDNFAEEDGKVRRIPIWLTTGDIPTAIPHNHKAFDGGNNVRAYSCYDGDTLMLKYLPKSVGTQPKKEDWVAVEFDPDKAPEDAPTGIKFGGLYKVNIKGIKGAGEIMVPTHSWYGLGNAVAVLRRVRTVLGRFSGLINGEPFLVLEKVQETVKTPDGKKQKQWITTFNTAVDMADLAIHADNRVGRGIAALNLFNGVRPAQAVEKPVQTTTVTPALALVDQKKPASPVSPDKTESPGNQADASGSLSAESKKAVESLHTLAKQNGLTVTELEAYAQFKLRNSLADEHDYSRLQKLYGELRTRLLADKVGMKTRCQELIRESKTAEQAGNIDPAVEGMLVEFNRLAELNDIPGEQLMAHLTALSGGFKPEQMKLQDLQNSYREVEAKFRSAEVGKFKAEIAINYLDYRKAA